MTIHGNDISIIVPCYNEEASIGPVLEGLLEAFPKAEIMVIDDGSTDLSGQIISEFASVKLIRHTSNKGYGACIKAGVRAATKDVTCWFDADGQHSPESLNKLLATYESAEFDAVIGVRTSDSPKVRSRQPGKAILTALVQFVARRRISDVNCGLRVFPTTLLRKYLHLLPDGFSASITTTLLMMRRGYNVALTPISIKPRTGKSSVNQLRDGLRSIHIIIRILIMFKAFFTFSLAAAALSSVGFIYSLYIAFQQRLGFPVAGAILILTGVIIFFMGLLCDQIVALRLEQMEFGAKSPDEPRIAPGDS